MSQKIGVIVVEFVKGTARDAYDVWAMVAVPLDVLRAAHPKGQKASRDPRLAIWGRLERMFPGREIKGYDWDPAKDEERRGQLFARTNPSKGAPSCCAHGLCTKKALPGKDHCGDHKQRKNPLPYRIAVVADGRQFRVATYKFDPAFAGDDTGGLTLVSERKGLKTLRAADEVAAAEKRRHESRGREVVVEPQIVRQMGHRNPSHPECPGVGPSHQHYQGKCFTDWNWGTGPNSREARRVWPVKYVYAIVRPGGMSGSWTWRVQQQSGPFPALKVGDAGSSTAAKAAATKFVESL